MKKPADAAKPGGLGRDSADGEVRADAADGSPAQRQVITDARAMRALEPSRLLVGHGPAADAPAAAMDAAIARSAKAVGEPANA